MANIWFWCEKKHYKVTPHVCRKRCDHHENCEKLEQEEIDRLVMPEIEEHLGSLRLSSLAALRQKIRER